MWLGLWIAALVLTVVICLLPMPAISSPSGHLDKVEHALGYAALAGWAAMLFGTRGARWAAGLGLVVLGVAIEGLQALLPWRSADLLDACANALGVLAGSLVTITPAARGLEWLDRALR